MTVLSIRPETSEKLDEKNFDVSNNKYNSLSGKGKQQFQLIKLTFLRVFADVFFRIFCLLRGLCVKGGYIMLLLSSALAGLAFGIVDDRLW